MRHSWVALGLLAACGEPVRPPSPAAPAPDLDLRCATERCGAGCGAGLSCDAEGACSSAAIDCTPPPREATDGWTDPPGTGVTFVVSSLAIADRDRGFDLGGSGAIDNALYMLGQLGNDDIRQHLLSGEVVLLIELAGLDDPALDSSLTVKVYGGRDADDPPFPADNYSIPSGATRCCELVIDPRSLEDGQARARLPARVRHGRLFVTDPGPLPIDLTITSTSGARTRVAARLERTHFVAKLSDNLGWLDDGVIGGALPVNDLARVANPFCDGIPGLCVGPTLLDLLRRMFEPDVDLDLPPDGLERLESGPGGGVVRCADGCGDACPPIPPVDPGDPSSCALHPRMDDGFSVGVTFSGVRATVHGIAGERP